MSKLKCYNCNAMFAIQKIPAPESEIRYNYCPCCGKWANDRPIESGKTSGDYTMPDAGVDG